MVLLECTPFLTYAKLHVVGAIHIDAYAECLQELQLSKGYCPYLKMKVSARVCESHVEQIDDLKSSINKSSDE